METKEAIDLLDNLIGMVDDNQENDYDTALRMAIDAMKVHTCDLISRQAAMEEISKQQTYKMFEGEDTVYLDANDVGSVLASLPSAQPEHTNSCYTNSWCINCKEYNKEKHSCPRFNRVIKQTLDEIYSHAEIVRCKDCKWFHDIGCAIRIVDDSDKPSENDYCSFAERRTDDTD